MLVIISDLHLGDGTTAASIPASAFLLFAKRLRQDAHFASMRYGKYRPIEELDVILMGDIVDPLHSTKWLFPPQGRERYVNIEGKDQPRITEEGDPDYVRPWSDPSHLLFAPKLLEVTRAVLEHNRESLAIMRRLARGEFIEFDPAAPDGSRDPGNLGKIPLKVRFHYMVGNHDWYYHLKGEAFDQIRREMIEAMGLSNPPSPFPYDLRKIHTRFKNWEQDEAPDIERLFRQYKVFGRHGDYFDPFNFNPKLGRDHATLGDAFTMEVCNRYPEELKRKPSLNPEIVDNLRHITNVRPALATPLWISGQITRLSNEQIITGMDERALKKIWDDLSEKFVNLKFVRSKDVPFKVDIVDKMQAAVRISKLISLETIDNLVYKIQNRRLFDGGHSFTEHALKEPAFLDDTARYIVYGHTHHQETVPLDHDERSGNQIYFNSGTWHTYFDLARKNPKEKKFIPYKALSYITFYKEDEHDDRDFETWTGAYA